MLQEKINEIARETAYETISEIISKFKQEIEKETNGYFLSENKVKDTNFYAFLSELEKKAIEVKQIQNRNAIENELIKMITKNN